MDQIIHGSFAPWAVKIGLALGIGVLAMKAPRPSKIVDFSIAAVVAVYLAVVVWNAALLLHLAGYGKVF